jgi:hypothetical protein
MQNFGWKPYEKRQLVGCIRTWEGLKIVLGVTGSEDVNWFQLGWAKGKYIFVM